MIHATTITLACLPLMLAVSLRARRARPASLRADMSLRAERARPTSLRADALCDSDGPCGQSVHWVFVTDCSAYQYNQGNLFLASAAAVKQPGNFTWVMYGCQGEQQKAEMQKIMHPRAQVFFATNEELTHPLTGEAYKDFQASNRPASLRQWWAAQPPAEEAISVVDPDMNFLRPVILVDNPRDINQAPYNGSWETMAVSPKQGSGAMYGQGCVLGRFNSSVVSHLCRGSETCERVPRDDKSCTDTYASGPPWIIHRDDAEAVYSRWVGNAIIMHEAWPELLAEQVSYGLTQMQLDIGNHLDRFWFLSSATDGAQPWKAVMAVDYEPCESRKPPESFLNLPPLWHACSTWNIPHIQGHFRLHKDHVHKDILDCDAPLIVYPPEDALKHYYTERNATGPVFQPQDTNGFILTWGLCTYTNMIDTYASAFKREYCDHPNLDPSFDYPPAASQFINRSSRLGTIFRSGGWTDVDYTVGAK